MLRNLINNHRTNIYLIIIILIASFFRLSWLAEIPNGFHQDESTTGYDAYSLLKTARNQYGEFLPLFSQAFGDYNESLSRFMTVPFIKIFGLNEFATRLPIALVGIFTIPVLYYLVKELFNRKLAIISALILAISPWHIQFSRIAYTGILLPFFFCLALLFFVKSLKHPSYFYLTAIAFAFSIYTYNPAKIFVPIFISYLIILFRKYLWRKKEAFISLLIFLPIFFFLFSFWISPEGMTRVRTSGGIINNPLDIILSYLSYFSPKFLFFSGDPNPRHSSPNMGQLYLVEIVTIIVGFWVLIRKQGYQRNILLFWLFMYPIPAALIGPNHALRSIVGIPVFTIISALGIYQILYLFKAWGKVALISTLLALTFSLAIYFNSYFLEYPKQSKYNTWRYGMKEAINYVEKSKYSCGIVSNQFHHINSFILFFTKFDPALYQKSPIDPLLSFRNQSSYSIGKFRIISINDINQYNYHQCVFMLMPNDLKTIRSLGLDWHEKYTIINPTGSAEIHLGEVTKNGKHSGGY